MMIRLYGTAPESIVDGPGLRYTVFFQGCIRHCTGCHNPESWPMYGGYKADTNEIKKEIVANKLLDGITLSGGEPFLQPAAALDICFWAKKRGYNVWCYTGYTFEEIIEWSDNRLQLLKNIDVLVDGPFEIVNRSLDIPWRGSTNQRLVDVQKSIAEGKVVKYAEE